MNAWTVVLLAADVVVVTAAVLVARLRYRDEPAQRRLWYGRAAYTGPLLVFVAVRAPHVGNCLTVILVGLALVPAVLLRWVTWMSKHPDYSEKLGGKLRNVTRGEFIAFIPVYAAIMVVLCAGLVLTPNDPKTDEQADSRRFGLYISRHNDNVATMVVDQRSPTVADTDVVDPYAVPVEKYAVDGQHLTLVVTHNGLCEPRLVLLGTVIGVLNVVVVYAPDPAIKSVRGGCRPDPADPLAIHSTVGVRLPGGPNFSSLVDAGAGGPATLVTAKPAR